MKVMKKISALVIAMVMVLAMALPAMADPTPVTNTHNITITNTDQNVIHTYKIFKVFSGNLNANQVTLSDIQWGNGVDSAKLLTALIAANADENSVLKGKFDGITTASSAYDVAMKLSGWSSTTSVDVAAGDIDAFAAIVAANLIEDNGVVFSSDSTTYVNQVDTDGYYFIKDVTDNDTLDGENGTDALSKYLLRISDDITIVAKDTGSQSNKVIVEAGNDVNDNNKNIGDEVVYKSTLAPIPNPVKYNWFKLTMEDTLEKGLTLTEITSIYMGDVLLTFGEDYYYVVGGTEYGKVANADGTYTAYTAPQDPVGTTGSHTADTTFRVIFKNPKALILDNNVVGKTLTANYKAVLNADAELAPESNDNTVHFVFSNDANFDYEGDDWKPNEPQGITPDKTVETYTTALEIKKVDGTNNNAALAGATFTITATDVFNVVRETGETFVAVTEGGTHWKLKDGSYTTTDPATVTDPDTQYASTTQKYNKVTYTNEIVSPDADSSNQVYTVTSGADGIIRLEGIKAGTYTVTEVAAPDGFNGIKGTVNAVIDWDHVHASNVWRAPQDRGRGGFVLTSSTGTEELKDAKFTMTASGTVVSQITIQNFQGSRLPSTGGIGTTIFYVIGGILVVLAGVVLVTKRKSAE
jgi:LPXTG-motif cell wall-anchored protein